MSTKPDTDQWVPKGYKAFGIAIMIGFSYLSSVFIGVLGYHPFSHTIVGDVLWGSLSMWLCTGLFITAHDAMHGLILPQKPKLNALLGKFALVCMRVYPINAFFGGMLSTTATPLLQKTLIFGLQSMDPLYGIFDLCSNTLPHCPLFLLQEPIIPLYMLSVSNQDVSLPCGLFRKS